MATKDYYKILGIDSDATEKEIKAAYRRLARKYHPDVNPGDRYAENRFKEISEAYSVLSDRDKRTYYNQMGSMWENKDFADSYNWANFNANDFQSVPTESVEFGGDLEDVLGDMFTGKDADGRFDLGGDTHTQKDRPRAGRKPNDIETEMIITLDEAYHGVKKYFFLGDKRLEVNIPKGVKAGQKIRLPKKGTRSRTGGERGDILLTIKMKPHNFLVRDGNDLRTEVRVDYLTALLGGDVPVNTLTGRITMRLPAGTQNGSELRVVGKGMPMVKSERFGNLYVRIAIVIPKNISDDERELLEKIRSKRI
ncbi:MAG: J domain-containing protein [Abditibacteriota bacterium]|nr:J domain-containing protein [Abditibacteriota bacterium]